MQSKDFIFYNAVPIICILGAIYLCIHDREGWGWLMLIAAMTAVMPKGKSNG